LGIANCSTVSSGKYHHKGFGEQGAKDKMMMSIEQTGPELSLAEKKKEYSLVITRERQWLP
jgi:hypothetical protein